MSFPRYPAYKNSGVEWLGEVPAHWNLQPLKYLADFRSGGTPDKSNIDYWEGDIPWASAKDLKTDHLFDTADHITDVAIESGTAALVPAGAVLVVVRGMILARIFPVTTAKVPIAINQDLKAIIAHRQIQPEFMAWLLRGSEAETLSRLDEAGHGTKALRMDTWGAMRLPVPSLEEQSAIASFLDRETAKIDALVAEQEKLITLLKEKRQAVISHAVTKGLDPSVPMKDSGVAWLGEVPAHWGVGALGYFASVTTGATPDRDNPRYWGGSIPWIKTGEINYHPIEDAEEFITEAGLKESSTKLMPPGTMLMAMYGQGATRGRVAILKMAATFNQACAAISCSDALNVDYLQHFFVVAYEHVRDDGNQTSQMNLSSGAICQMRVTVPPVTEQLAISQELDKVTVKIDRLTAEAQSAITLLQERRTTLISAAVTGQIDVRGITA